MITVVTDSTVYMTGAEARQWQLNVVPMSYTVNGQLYIEDFADQNGCFDKLIFDQRAQCGTAQVSVGAFMSTFSELLQKGAEILCITISSRLSGTYSSAMIAARETDPTKIAVVDSLSTAGGMKLIVERACMIAKEGTSLQNAAERVRQLRSKIGIVFSVEEMDSLRRSGRIGIVRQSAGTILNIRPILLCKNGTIISQGRARGFAEQMRELTGLVPKNAQRLIAHYIRQDALSKRFLAQATAIFGRRVRPGMLGPVLGIHLGTGVIGLAWIEE